MNVTDHRKRHRGAHARNWNRGKSLTNGDKDQKKLVINTSIQPPSPAPPLIVNAMGNTAPRLRKGSTVLSQSPSNLSSNLQKFQYLAQQKGVQLTRILHSPSPGATNSLWPLIPAKKDYSKMKKQASKSPENFSSPKLGQTYAQYNTNNGIGGVNYRMTTNSPQQSFGNSTKQHQSSKSRLFGVQSPFGDNSNRGNHVSFQLFEPTSYGIKIEGNQAPLNRKNGYYQPQKSTIITDGLNSEINKFLETKAFPNLTTRHHNHQSSLSGKQETEFNHEQESYNDVERNGRLLTFPHGSYNNLASDHDEEKIYVMDHTKNEQTLLNSNNTTQRKYSQQFLMGQTIAQPIQNLDNLKSGLQESSLSNSQINIPSPNIDSRVNIVLKDSDSKQIEMNLSADKFKKNYQKQRMKISIKKSPKLSRQNFSPHELSQSNSPTISPNIRSPSDIIGMGLANSTGLNFKPTLIKTQAKQFSSLSRNLQIVKNSSIESQEFLKGETNVDYEMNQFPEMNVTGFDHIQLSQSMLLHDDQEGGSRRSSNDIYDDIREGDESKTQMLNQAATKKVYDKFIDSIIINIDQGPQRLQNKLILGCFSDMDWKIYSQQKIDRIKYGEDLFWSEKPFSYQVFNAMKPYQMINQFPRMHHISRGDNLIQNLQKMKNMFPRDYKIFPKTWFLPQDLVALQQFFKNQKNQDTSNYSSGYFQFNQGPVFIMKPLQMARQKRNQWTSKIVESFDEIQEIAVGPSTTPETFGENPIDGPIGEQNKFLVQSYIKNPLLIDGRKFDMRFYVLVTSCNPLTVFVHRQGFTRMAKQKYTLGHYENKDIHKTFDNQQAASFPIQVDPSARTQNMGTLEDGFQTLQKRGFNTQNMKTMIHDVIIKTLLSIQPDMLHNYKVSQPTDTEFDMCFQLLSFDMIIDQNRRPWLVNVESNPDLSQSATTFENRVKRFIIMDTLKLLNLTVAEKEKRLQLNEQLQKQKSSLQKVKHNDAKFSVGKLQTTNMRSRKLAHWADNLGGYDWIFPIGSKKVGKTQNPSDVPNVRDTHYMSPDSNMETSDIGAGGGSFNFKLAGQTSLGQTNTMANLNAGNETALLGNKSSHPHAYGSSNNLMQTIPQFPSANPVTSSQISNAHRTLKVGSDHIAAPAITQVRIKRVNNLEKQEDTHLESGDISSVENHTANKLPKNPDLSAGTKKEAPEQITEEVVKEETLEFKNQQDAQNYYDIFQKTMNNISQKKKTQLMSPAQIMERNFVETLRNNNSKANLRFELANPTPLSKSPSSKFQMYLNANKTVKNGMKSLPKFEQMVQKIVMNNEKNHPNKPSSPSIYNLVRQDVSPDESEYNKTNYERQRSLQLSRFVSIPNGWQHDQSNESMTDLSPFSHTLKAQQLQVLRMTGSSPDEILDLANQNQMDESQLYDYIMKNPDFKKQMHHDQIQHMVKDFQQKYGNKKVQKKPIQQQQMHQVVQRSPVQQRPSPGRVMQRTYQNPLNNQSPAQTSKILERSQSNRQSPSQTIYYGQKPQQSNAWLKRMHFQVEKRRQQIPNATTLTNMDKLSEMQELKKKLLSNTMFQQAQTESRHVFDLPRNKSNETQATVKNAHATHTNFNNQTATRNIVAQNYQVTNVDTPKGSARGAIDTQEHSVNVSVKDNLDMNHLLVLNKIDSQVINQERQYTDSNSHLVDIERQRDILDTIKTLNQSQPSKTLLNHQLSSKKLLLDQELSMTKGEIPEGPIKYSNLLSPINSLQKTQLQAPSSQNEYRRQGSFEGRQSKDLNLNDVSVESLMNASLNKDVFNDSVHHHLPSPLKSPILKAAKMFENQNLHAQMPKAIRFQAPEIKNMKSFPTEGEEATLYNQGVSLPTGLEPERKHQKLRLELKNAGPPTQQTLGIQSTTHLGEQGQMNAESRAQLQVSDSMINHVINDNLNKTISPSYLNSSNPRLFPVIYNNEQSAVNLTSKIGTFGARSKSVIPQQSITSSQFLGNPNKSWYEHKYGYSKNQNRVDYADVDIHPIELDAENEIKEQLDSLLQSPSGKRILPPSASNTESKLFLALNKQRESGASGHKLTLLESPSIGLIKMAARSNSTITGGIKNLKLPQLGKKCYIPSSTRNDYENSKITSHVELRQLKQFQQGMLHPKDLSAHMKTMVGIRRQSQTNETKVEQILSRYVDLKEAQFQNAFSQSQININ